MMPKARQNGHNEGHLERNPNPKNDPRHKFDVTIDGPFLQDHIAQESSGENRLPPGTSMK